MKCILEIISLNRRKLVKIYLYFNSLHIFLFILCLVEKKENDGRKKIEI